MFSQRSFSNLLLRWINKYVVAGIFIMIFSCKESDDLPPVLTLIGNDTILHVLNSSYDDPGAKATDETDGEITNKIFTENTVNVQHIGEYTVTYRVIDQAGNEAVPLIRRVFVYNSGWQAEGQYTVAENQIFPEVNFCSYSLTVLVDSFANNRIIYSNFGCNQDQQVYADIDNTILILPFQEITDSTGSMSFQGSGSITDTTMFLHYTLERDSVTELWTAEIMRSK